MVCTACKERSNFHKDDAAKLRHQLAQVLKDKEDLQTSFEEERESFKAEIDGSCPYAVLSVLHLA